MGRGRSQDTLSLIEACWNILDEIQPCSVRAVCYRLFTMDLITSMAKNETNKISNLLARAREDGAIPWEWIVDETRRIEQASLWKDPKEFLDMVKRAYRKDHWTMQEHHVECWSEKGTIRGTVQPVLDEFGVGFRVLHGYGSATALNDIAAAASASDKQWQIFYIGDFDPSGMDMSEHDIPTRLESYGAQNINVERLALTEEDVFLGHLPHYALDSKQLDKRYRWYVETYGALARGRCWEVDALSPVVLRDRLKGAIMDELDIVQWTRSITAETAEQASIKTFVAGWKSISGQASK
jgi:hypothetical protein